MSDGTGRTTRRDLIVTPEDLDALPVGSVALGREPGPGARRPLAERVACWRDPEALWRIDGQHYYQHEVALTVLNGGATILHWADAPEEQTMAPSRAEPTTDEIEAAMATWFEWTTHAGAYAGVAEHVKDLNRPRMRAALLAVAGLRAEPPHPNRT